MPNHVHLLVETPAPTLGSGMCRVHGQYARAFNRRHGRVGHLFQGRFGSTRVQDDPHLWMVVAYIAHNPVASGLCVDADDWPWASHAAVVGAERGAGWFDARKLLDLLAGFVGGRGRDAYRRCVDGGDGGGGAR